MRIQDRDIESEKAKTAYRPNIRARKLDHNSYRTTHGTSTSRCRREECARSITSLDGLAFSRWGTMTWEEIVVPVMECANDDTARKTEGPWRKRGEGGSLHSLFENAKGIWRGSLILDS